MTHNWLLLLIPRFLALRNGFRRQGQGGWTRTLVLLTLMILFWGGIYWFFSRALGYFLTIPELGPILNQKMLSMVFLTFFAILLFSNVITGLSTFFLSRDLTQALLVNYIKFNLSNNLNFEFKINKTALRINSE